MREICGKWNDMKQRKVFVNPIYKDRARVLKTSKDTNGKYLLGELEVAPGGGNFPHIHTAFEETFIAVKGVLGVRVKDRKFYLYPGESLTVPVGTPHCFFNDGKESIVCHIRFEPPHEDFLKGLAIAYGLASEGKMSKKGVPKNSSILH